MLQPNFWKEIRLQLGHCGLLIVCCNTAFISAICLKKHFSNIFGCQRWALPGHDDLVFLHQLYYFYAIFKGFESG